MFSFFKRLVAREEQSLEDRIANMASSTCFRGKEAEIAHDIIYDRRGARSLLGWDKELEARVGSITTKPSGVRQEDAAALEAEIIKRISPAPTPTGP